jgi:hypothetical protein
MDTGEVLSPAVSRPPQGTEIGGDERFSEPVAERLLCAYVYEYEEIADQIRSWVRDLLSRGVTASEAEAMVKDEIEKVKPRLLAEREERMRRIQDPRTRAGVVPLREIERQLLSTYGSGDGKVAQARQHLAGTLGVVKADAQAIDSAVRDAELAAEAAALDADVLFGAQVASGGGALRQPEERPEKKKFEVLFGWLKGLGKH